jgi:hypothetical protein
VLYDGVLLTARRVVQKYVGDTIVAANEKSRLSVNV